MPTTTHRTTPSDTLRRNIVPSSLTRALAARTVSPMAAAGRRPTAALLLAGLALAGCGGGPSRRQPAGRAAAAAAPATVAMTATTPAPTEPARATPSTAPTAASTTAAPVASDAATLGVTLAQSEEAVRRD